MPWRKIIALGSFIVVSVFSSSARSFSAEQAIEVSAEDQELIANLDLISMLDLMGEDQDMLSNYEVIASNDEKDLSVQQKEGGQNE